MGFDHGRFEAWAPEPHGGRARQSDLNFLLPHLCITQKAIFTKPAVHQEHPRTFKLPEQLALLYLLKCHAKDVWNHEQSPRLAFRAGVAAFRAWRKFQVRLQAVRLYQVSGLMFFVCSRIQVEHWKWAEEVGT